jgi:hypothetical protein
MCKAMRKRATVEQVYSKPIMCLNCHLVVTVSVTIETFS